jgi:putative ABC transport system permease protein
MKVSERWFRLLLRLYPADFRDEMGDAIVETYRDRAHEALKRGRVFLLPVVWVVALADSLHNGLGERVWPAASWRRAGHWGRDAEFAFRRLTRSPALVAAVVGTLTVGLGMFAVVYTVVQKVLIEPLPYRHPDDLHFVWRDYGPILELKRGWLGGPDVAALQQTGGVIEDAAGLLRQLATFSPPDGAEPTEIAVMITSPNLFRLLGVEPFLGRGFARDEVGPGRHPVIVLTHELWNGLGADPSIVGRVVRLNEQPYTVIGVMPPTFAFVRNASLGPPQRAEAYVTFDVNLAETRPGAGSYAGLIRARHDASPASVAAAVDAVGRDIDARDFESRGLRLYPLGVKADLISRVRPALVVLAFAGAFLLLVLMFNLGSVLLARAAQREHEFAVSRALGADGVAVVRVLLVEGAVLGLLGGAAGTTLAIWGTRALVALAPLDLPRIEAIAVDGSIAVVVLAVGGLLGLLAATVPATWAARADLSTLLASSAVRGGGGHGRMRRGMVVAQVALSLVLLAMGGLVVRSFERLLRADPGFRPEGVLTMRLPMPTQVFAEARHVLDLHNRVERALVSLPGVSGVSATNALPLMAGARQSQFAIPGAPGNTGDAARDVPLVDVIMARRDYFEVMGMRVLAGRTFTDGRSTDVHEVVIDRHLAEQFFPTGTPIGTKIPFQPGQPIPVPGDLIIVGVVDQARLYDVHQDGRPQLFVRAEDWGARTLSFVLRTAREPKDVIPDVRGAIRRIDPRLTVADVRPMGDIIGNAVRQQRLSAVLIAGFALGALLLAAMGLFGVIAGSVTRRRHEIGVRMALGADHPRVLRLVLSEGVALVGMGMLIGVPGVYLAGGLLRGVLVDVSPSDPATLLAVAAGLALVALAACYLPARRVLRIEPAEALRQE